MSNITPSEIIFNKIYVFRGVKVMIDRDLAELYEVDTKVLNQAVKRNLSRFPPDFMFQITNEEKKELVTACDRFASLKHSSSNPYVFTEQGVSMLSSVLNSERAIQVNIQIMRTFSRLRQMLTAHEDLKRKVDSMEKKYDQKFKMVFDAIKELITDELKPKRRIGFERKNKK